MTFEELADELARAHESGAQRKEVVPEVILFGVRRAGELDTVNINDLAARVRHTTGRKVSPEAVRWGLKLAKYVEQKRAREC